MKTSALYSELNEIIITLVYSIIARVNNRRDTLDNTTKHIIIVAGQYHINVHVNTHILAL